MANDKFDNMLLNILKEGDLFTFFDAIFGFLSRRTDFYYIQKSANDPVGLPKGWPEKIVFQALEKYTPKQIPYEISEPNISPEEVPVVISEVEVSSEDISNECNSNFESTSTVEKDNRKTIKAKRKIDCNKMITDSVNLNSTVNSENILSSISNSSECYNGASFEKYSWSQTITDLDICIRLPLNISSKNLMIDVSNKKLNINIKNNSDLQEYVCGELSHQIKAQECIWSVEKNILQIHLEKYSELWWDCFYINEPKLDFKHMDCSRPLEDLSSDAQAVVDRLQWDSEQKRQGLPTSDQILNERMLQKAWNAKGSPFAGTPFDPTKIKFGE